jgi:hypothetical protein
VAISVRRVSLRFMYGRAAPCLNLLCTTSPDLVCLAFKQRHAESAYRVAHTAAYDRPP